MLEGTQQTEAREGRESRSIDRRWSRSSEGSMMDGWMNE